MKGNYTTTLGSWIGIDITITMYNRDDRSKIGIIIRMMMKPSTLVQPNTVSSLWVLIRALFWRLWYERSSPSRRERVCCVQ